MKSKSYLSILFCCCALPLFLTAQNAEQREWIRSQSNLPALRKIAEKADREYRDALQNRSPRVPLVVQDRQGNTGYWSGIDVEGLPIYDYDDNDRAAISSRVDHIWVGGDSGLDLTGEGIIIGHWEAGGLPLVGHVEFGGRVLHRDNEAVTSHGTHTAGTMIATGERNAARGMASGAELHAYRSNNDLAEMTAFALDGGLVSNHSYSKGNPDGDIPRYGVYTDLAASWDEMYYNAPYFLSCKSAGNNRNDGVNVADQGFDLMYTVATCKNIITVGAVQDVLGYNSPNSVRQAAFNNWGPTDDWRIKPDLTSNGVSLESSDNGSVTDYGTKSGTSMSTPVVTGTIALLQEHYLALNGVFMRAATAKGLLISTTLEAGLADGPDFISGWGLLNAEEAARVVNDNGSNALIEELRLNEGDSITFELELEDLEQFTATISWTDPAGQPGSQVIEDVLTPRLVNDLNVRLRGNGTVYEPWTFEPNEEANNFGDRPQKGNNQRDNVERIDVEDLPAGTYTLTISHSGTLRNNRQDFALIINDGLRLSVATATPARPTSLLRVFPNPVEDGSLFVQRLASPNAADWQLRLYDLQGRLLGEEVMTDEVHRFSLGQRPPGIYWLLVQMGDESRLEKFVIK
ncbi:MAG: S8 family serine peptidase [Bacteroidota bacterium]